MHDLKCQWTPQRSHLLRRPLTIESKKAPGIAWGLLLNCLNRDRPNFALKKAQFNALCGTLLFHTQHRLKRNYPSKSTSLGYDVTPECCQSATRCRLFSPLTVSVQKFAPRIASHTASVTSCVVAVPPTSGVITPSLQTFSTARIMRFTACPSPRCSSI